MRYHFNVMSDTLKRIKRVLLAGNYEFSVKALIELDTDGLTESDVVEAILGASAIYKTIRSTSGYRQVHREYLHIILGANLDGIGVYPKGKLVAQAGVETYYFMISSKRALH